VFFLQASFEKPLWFVLFVQGQMEKKETLFSRFFASFSYLFFLFYFIFSFIPRFILPYAKILILFQKVNLTKLLFFYSTCLFRHLDLSFSLFRLCSQISDKNSMTILLLRKWTSTSASAGWNASLVHPVFWPTRSVDCLQIVARKIHTRSFCSSSLLQYN
jgi:hypothetical protein